MATPNNPTDTLDLDRRGTDGNPFPAENYDDNMGKLDAHAAAVLASLAEKLNLSGGDLSGLLNFDLDGIFAVFGESSDKFTIQRYDDQFHLLYNAYHNDANWVHRDVSLPAFRVSFTQAGALSFYTSPAAPTITWTKRFELTSTQVLSLAPFATQAAATFGGTATFNSNAAFNEVANFVKVVTLGAGATVNNTMNHNFEGLWQVLGSEADKLTVQRVSSEGSIYLSYNLYHNGSAWTVRDATKPSLAIQYTEGGEIRVRHAPAASNSWSTILTVTSTDLVVNKRMSATGSDYAAIFGTSTDKLVVIRNSTSGEYSLAYNVSAADATTKHDVAKASTRLTFTTNGLVQVWHAPAGATNTWTKIFEMGASAVTIGKAVNLAHQLTSTVEEGTAPFVVASSTVVTNLNADKLDGQHASEIIAAATGAWLYESEWTDVVDNNTYTFTHNLGYRPKEVVIQYRENSSSEVTTILYPGATSSPSTSDGSYRLSIWFNGDTTLRLFADTYVGLNGSGSIRTSGQWKVFAR